MYIKIYYDNPYEWHNPYIYVYDAASTKCDVSEAAPWPGEQLVKEGRWYTYKKTNCRTAKVIFNNNYGGQDPGPGQKGYEVEGEMWYYKGQWYSENPIE